MEKKSGKDIFELYAQDPQHADRVVVGLAYGFIPGRGPGIVLRFLQPLPPILA